MEAKDTVMTGRQIDMEMDRIEKLDTSYTSAEFELCKAQAEISFKVGQRNTLDKLIEAEKREDKLIIFDFALSPSETEGLYLLQHPYYAGERKVVEWVRNNLVDESNPIPVGDSVYLRFRKPLDLDKWQSKLKEWGIR